LRPFCPAQPSRDNSTVLPSTPSVFPTGFQAPSPAHSQQRFGRELASASEVADSSSVPCPRMALISAAASVYVLLDLRQSTASPSRNPLGLRSPPRRPSTATAVPGFVACPLVPSFGAVDHQGSLQVHPTRRITFSCPWLTDHVSGGYATTAAGSWRHASRFPSRLSTSRLRFYAHPVFPREVEALLTSAYSIPSPGPPTGFTTFSAVRHDRGWLLLIPGCGALPGRQGITGRRPAAFQPANPLHPRPTFHRRGGE